MRTGIDVASRLIALAALTACSPSAEPRQQATSELSGDAVVTLPTASAAPPPTATGIAPSAPTTTASALGSAVGPCSKSADCSWNNNCVASKCLLGVRPHQACEESAPLPGDCRCLAGQCATVYKGTSGSCATDADCSWDDPCMPRSCRKGAARPANCDESSLPPGACLCVDHVCAGIAR